MSSALLSGPQAASEICSAKSLARLPKILCIDDDPAICRSLQIQLQNYAVQVFTSSFGSQGYWEALVHQPDVIITDLRMPQGSGEYVVECLKRNPGTRDIPIIVLTGRRDQGLQRYLRGLGIAQYLVKPLAFEDLRTELRRFITLLPRNVDDLDSQTDQNVEPEESCVSAVRSAEE
jgi:CheY-like chemotaxis protein